MPDIALAVAGLWFWYDDESIPVLRGLDLVVRRGEFLALLGANGSGKTTLLRMIAGAHRPLSGQIRIGSAAVFEQAGGGRTQAVELTLMKDMDETIAALGVSRLRKVAGSAVRTWKCLPNGRMFRNAISSTTCAALWALDGVDAEPAVPVILK